jgi:alkylated DNA repair protein alkB family protein 1
MAAHLDAHAKPPDSIRQIYKHFQKLNPRAVDQDNGIIDTRLLHEGHPHVSPTSLLQLPANIREIFTNFAGGQITATEEAKVYSVHAIPGKSANLNIGSGTRSEVKW